MAEGSIAADELRLLIERIERLEEEKKAIADDVKDVYGEAKSRGYDTKTIRTIVRLRQMATHDRKEAEPTLRGYATKTTRTIVRLRKMETHDRQEADALLETYKAALGLD